jgi:glycosyltransferase involved in cell wall biosynthesis
MHALGKLDGPERYTIVAQTADSADLLRPLCGQQQTLIVRDHTEAPRGGARDLVRPIIRYLQHRLAPARRWPEVPVSDGFFESLGCDVVHFPSAWYMYCALPTVYNPHDLQHLQYPQNFTLSDLVFRETVMPAGCRYSQAVIVGTQWVKDDVVRRYAVDPQKIQVVPWASVTQFCEEPDADRLSLVSRKYQIETPFVLYPAGTYPYKNHLRLLEALAHLRDSEGLRVRLVCTGGLIDWHWPRVQERVKELGLEAQVKFLGIVPDADLRALYRLARLLIMPTLYEADSNPIHEAWYEGVPVASSNVTALPDQVQDAGLLFDASDVGAMANAIARLATDERLRADLVQRGYRRARDFDWERTAKAYRAVYRRAAGFPLTDEDRWLLQWDWLREPDRRVPSSALQALSS